MPTPGHADVTALLAAWAAGDAGALDALMPLVYDELHRLAARSLREEQAGTLQTTALVHEAYMRLVGARVEWEGHAHFLAVAARTMRRVLVDHARARRRQKRGGGMAVTLGDHPAPTAADPIDIIAVDVALEELAGIDERKARILELHYFAGATYEDTAKLLGVSAITVHRDLRFARTWMQDRLKSA